MLYVGKVRERKNERRMKGRKGRHQTEGLRRKERVKGRVKERD